MTILLLSCLPKQLLANPKAMPLWHDEVQSSIWNGLEQARIAGGNPVWILLQEKPPNASIARATYTLGSRPPLLPVRMVVDGPPTACDLYEGYIIFAATLLTPETSRMNSM